MMMMMKSISFFLLLSTTQQTLVSATARDAVMGAALQGGAEFVAEDSYQSKALAYTETLSTVLTDADYIEYYALACFYYASFGVPNKRTQEENLGAELPGWIDSTNWVSTTRSKCDWNGVECSKGSVSKLNLNSNRLYGVVAPELQLLSNLEHIDFFNNYFLVSEGDEGNAWIGAMPQLRFLYFSGTSFEYEGIPAFLNQLTNLEELDVSNSECRFCLFGLL